MTLPTGNKRGRPPGVKNKPAPPMTVKRFRELFNEVYSASQQKALFKELRPSELFKLLAALEPREKAEAAAPTTLFNVRLGPEVCPHCGGGLTPPSPEAPKLLGDDPPRDPDAVKGLLAGHPRTERKLKEVSPEEEEAARRARNFEEERQRLNAEVYAHDSALREENAMRARLGLPLKDRLGPISEPGDEIP